jgi:hypothetical protein
MRERHAGSIQAGRVVPRIDGVTGAFDGGAEPSGAERLQQVVDSLELECRHRVPVIGRREHDGRHRPHRLQAFCDIRARNFGDVNIQQHDHRL